MIRGWVLWLPALHPWPATPARGKLGTDPPPPDPRTHAPKPLRPTRPDTT